MQAATAGDGCGAAFALLPVLVARGDAAEAPDVLSIAKLDRARRDNCRRHRHRLALVLGYLAADIDVVGVLRRTLALPRDGAAIAEIGTSPSRTRRPRRG